MPFLGSERAWKEGRGRKEGEEGERLGEPYTGGYKIYHSLSSLFKEGPLGKKEDGRKEEPL